MTNKATGVESLVRHASLHLRRVNCWADEHVACDVVWLAVCVVFFVVSISVFRALGVRGKDLDLFGYLFTITVLPPVVALLFRDRRELTFEFPMPTSRAAQAWGLPAALLMLPVLYFDFSLAVEPLHYMTIMGPAVHLFHGGRLMVDTFSQYGPGLVTVAWIAMKWGAISFGSVNLAIQLLNFLYYAGFLIFLNVVVRSRIEALLLGLLCIGFLCVSWGHGESNINIAPSAGGQRYLLTLGMVVAIAVLKPPARNSVLTATMTALSAVWAADTLFATMAIHLAFIGALAVRDREWTRGFCDSLIAIAPAVAGVLAFCVAVLAFTGAWPRFDLYLDFFYVYNPTNDFWAKPLGTYWWIPMLAFGVLLMCHIWIRLIRGVQSGGTTRLVYQVLPMLLLFFWAALYFVGRAIDYTLLKAFLPFVAVAIPEAFNLLHTRARQWVLAILIVAVLYGGWSIISLFSPTSSYVFYIHECRDLGHCNPRDLVAELQRRMEQRPAMERVGNPWSDFRLGHDGVLTEAVALIQTVATEKDLVTVLLGRVQYITYLSDMALFYTGHWHRWPISLTFTDDLVPAISKSILAAPIRLREGEVIIVRRDLSTFEGVEKAIFDKIHANYRLCEISNQSKQVTAYRATSAARCST